MQYPGSLTDVPGVKVGHFTDADAGTGTTAVIFESGARGGVDIRGLACGSRELLTLDGLHVTPCCHALCLSGGSAFGLAAADGVMRSLADRNIGYFARVAVVPIVVGAIIFDLSFKKVARPDATYGSRAAEAATDGPVEMGSVGAGTGATVGKILGPDHATKGGLGSASARTADGVSVGALAVVNNLGDVLDWRDGRILAGARGPEGFVDSARVLASLTSLAPAAPPIGQATNLVAVCTDAALDKNGAAKLARMASAGMARALRPAFITFDGDLCFAFSTGDRAADVNVLGAIAADLVGRAINRAVVAADGLGVLPSAAELSPWWVD